MHVTKAADIFFEAILRGTLSVIIKIKNKIIKSFHRKLLILIKTVKTNKQFLYENIYHFAIFQSSLYRPLSTLAIDTEVSLRALLL